MENVRDEVQQNNELTPFRPLTQNHLRIPAENDTKTDSKSSMKRKRHIKRNIKPNHNLRAGQKLPPSIADFFLPEYIGKPLEDFDEFYGDKKTFNVIGKDKTIFRFSATNGFFVFSPFNCFRRAAIYILVHPVFSALVIITIIANCVVMAMNLNEKVSDIAEYVFTCIYTLEACVKLIARGLVFAPFTYFRDPWNWLDFGVITISYLTIFEQDINVSTLRTFRVLRALKTISVKPGLKTVVGALLGSILRLRDVTILAFFILSIFALVGMQLYGGQLHNKCLLSANVSNEEWNNYSSNSKNWHPFESETKTMCGNESYSGKCPNKYTCIKNLGENPNYGYTNFDNFGWALLSAFRLMTQDNWENLYILVLRAQGIPHVIFFILVILLCSFYLVNLILAIVAMAFDEQRKLDKAIAEKLAAEKRMEQDNIAMELKKFLQQLNKHQDLEIISEETQQDQTYNDVSITSTPTKKNSGKKFATVTRKQVIPVLAALRLLKQNKSAALKVNDEMHKHHKSRLQSISMHDFSFIDDENNSSCQEDLPVSSVAHKVSVVPQRASIRRFLKGSTRHIDHKPRPNGTSGELVYCDDYTCNEAIEVVRKSVLCMKKETLKEKFYRIFLDWDSPTWLVKIQNCVGCVILDGFVEFFITLCIIANTVVMAMEHHGIDKNTVDVIEMANQVFTCIFAVEACLKIVAMGISKYLEDRWNCFDFFVAVVSILEMMLQKWNGLSVLRTFRLLRIFKLAKSWPTLHMLFTIMARTLGDFGSLTFVLCVVVFIFAVTGQQLFSDNYKNKSQPNWNFSNFFHSFMLVFRILCGEWIESMWECLHDAGTSHYACIPFFILTFIIGNYVLLNLFLALLLTSFEVEDRLTDTSKKVKVRQNKMLEAFGRFSRIWSIIKAHVNGKNKRQGTVKETNHGNGTIEMVQNVVLETMATGMMSTDANKRSENRPNGAIADEDISNSFKDSEKKAFKKTDTSYPSDCFCQSCVRKCCCCSLCGRTVVGRIWWKLRCALYNVVHHKYFETLIFVMIIASSITLAFEDKYLDEKPILKKILEYLDIIFTLVFLTEMLLKWIAFGFKHYFMDAWCCLDFIIVVISCIFLSLKTFDNNHVEGLQAMRTLRALRPLRAVSKWEGMKVVVNALIKAIPSIFNVMFVCLVFWLIFGIIGVEYFSGKFYKCVDDNDTPLNISSEDCYPNDTLNATWKNSPVNFDNVLIAYLALFQIATFQGWDGLLESAARADESTGDHTLRYFMTHLYFVLFIIFGSFFTLNLFIGVLIENFNMQKKKAGGASLELFMTNDQKMYYQWMKQIQSKRPAKAIPKPKWFPGNILYDITSSQIFELTIMVFIILNMISMLLEHDDQDETFTKTLHWINLSFIMIFAVECLMKLIALRHFYFTIRWNLFDFAVVVSSIIESSWRSESFSPTLLRVIRVFRISRVLRLVKSAKGIRTLIFSLAVSLPALLNIGSLLFLVIYIYAVFGMSFFKDVQIPCGHEDVVCGALDDVINFTTFFNSLVTLFQMCTAAGWDGVLKALLNNQSYPLVVFYLVSYLVISFLVVVNMYIAVIIENFSQATEEVQQGLTQEDFDIFYEHWEKYDPDATQYIPLEELSDFVDNIEKPLRIPFPNRFVLEKLDIPIYEGDLCHCKDILDALIKHFMGTPNTGDVAIETRTPGKNEKHYEVISSTLKRSKELRAARVIQAAFRKFHLYKYRYSETRQGGEVPPNPDVQTIACEDVDKNKYNGSTA